MNDICMRRISRFVATCSLFVVVVTAPAWADETDGIPASGASPGHWVVPAFGPGRPGHSGTEAPGGYSKVQIQFDAPAKTSDGGIYIRQATGGREIRINGWEPGETRYKPIVEKNHTFYRMYLGYQDKLFDSSNDEVTIQIFASQTDKLLATLHLHPYAEGTKGRIPIVVQGKTVGFYLVKHSTPDGDQSKIDGEQASAKVVTQDDMAAPPSEVYGRKNTAQKAQ